MQPLSSNGQKCSLLRKIFSELLLDHLPFSHPVTALHLCTFFLRWSKLYSLCFYSFTYCGYVCCVQLLWVYVLSFMLMQWLFCPLWINWFRPLLEHEPLPHCLFASHVKHDREKQEPLMNCCLSCLSLPLLSYLNVTLKMTEVCKVDWPRTVQGVLYRVHTMGKALG